MFEHDRPVEEELLVKEEESDDASGARAEQAQKAKKMQRRCRVVEQELHTDQVEQDSNGSGKAVVRPALLTKRISDGNFRDRRP